MSQKKLENIYFSNETEFQSETTADSCNFCNQCQPVNKTPKILLLLAHSPPQLSFMLDQFLKKFDKNIKQESVNRNEKEIVQGVEARESFSSEFSIVFGFFEEIFHKTFSSFDDMRFVLFWPQPNWKIFVVFIAHLIVHSSHFVVFEFPAAAHEKIQKLNLEENF